MTDLSIAQITHWRKRKRTITLAIICAGYLLIAIFLIWFFNRDQAKAGFSRLGAVGMIAVFLGAFHLADRCKRGWVFLLIGGLGGMLLVPLYASDTHLGLAAHFSATVSLFGWIAFILGTSLMTRLVAVVRWKLAKDLPTESPRCANCGYDLRASNNICPECGQPFDHADKNTYVSTVRQWEFRWLIRRITLLSACTVVPLAIVFGWLYFRSERPDIIAVQRLGGSVGTESDVSPQWQEFAPPIDWLFSRAWLVDFSATPLTSDNQLSCLKNLTTIRSLNLTGSPITGNALANLIHGEKLTDLKLGSTRITDTDMANIVRFRSLVSVDLTGTTISDAAIPQLSQLPALQNLILDNTRITEPGLEKLAGMHTLRFLSAMPVKMTAEQWKAIRQKHGVGFFVVRVRVSLPVTPLGHMIRPTTHP